MPQKMQTRITATTLLRPVMQVMAALIFLTMFAALTPARAQTVAPAETMLEEALGTVLVVRSAGNDDRFLGSAFLWGDGAVAVTNAHVVGDADEVRLIDAAGRALAGVVIGVDAVRDVAVIAVKAGRDGLIPGPAPALGAEVWAIGAPLGADFTVTRGMVSAHARQVEAAVPIRFLQHDAAVNPGSSGGPLIDAAGRLVGMNSRIADGSRHYIGISYAIAAGDLARIVEGLIAETLLPFPKLGLQLRPVSREIADALALEPTGVLIDRVMPGELAERAGLQAGDIILTAGGTALKQPGDLAFAIDAALTTGEVMLGLYRAGQTIELPLGLHLTDLGILATRGLEGAGLERTRSYRLEALGLTLGEGGRIDGVTENSPALFAGIIRGDVILSLNGHALSAEDLRRTDITAPALLLLKRAGGSTLHVILNPWDSGDGVRIIGGANVLDPAVVVF
jgi:serine protease Do